MSVELTEAQKQEERVKVQQYAELQGIAYVDPYPEQAPEDKKPEQPELSTDQLLELIKKNTGISLSSLADLDKLKPQPTEEEIAAQKEKRNTEMLTYGLSQGKFKKEEYDAYQTAIANKKDLVRGEISAQLTEANPEMAPEAIQEMVANYFFENMEETHPLRVAREKEITTLSELQIKNKFKNIVNLPTDFEQYEEGLNRQLNNEKKIQATLPVYKADVNRALQSLRTFTVEIPDTKNPANTVSVDLDYDDKDLKEVEDQFLSNDMIIRAVKDGVTLDQLKGEAKMVLVEKHLSRLISQAAKKYNATQKDGYIQGRKGLNSGSDNLAIHDDKLGDTLEDVYKELIASAPVKA